VVSLDLYKLYSHFVSIFPFEKYNKIKKQIFGRIDNYDYLNIEH
jgi:hypothetical protein